MNDYTTHYLSETRGRYQATESLQLLPRADVDSNAQIAVKRYIQANKAITAQLQRGVGITLASDVADAVYSVSVPSVEDYFANVSASDDERTLSDTG